MSAAHRASRPFLAAAGSIALITLLARIVGFGRWFAFSHSVGASCVGSVYQSVNAVPNVIFEIAAGGVLAAVAVPLVAAALARGDARSADQTASALLTWALVLLIPLGAVVAVLARPIATALLGTGCAGELELGAEMLVIFSIQIPLYGVGIVLAGVLQSHRRFIAAALAPLLSSLVVIATYLAYRGMVDQPAAPIAAIPPSATTLLAVGTTLGVLALSLPLLVPVRRAGIRLRPSLAFPGAVGRRVRVLAGAGLLAIAGQQLAMLIVIRLANDRGGAGTLNVFTYAQAVTLLPYAVLAVPIATAAFPSLAGADVRDSAVGEAVDGAGGAVDGVVESPGGVAGETLRRAWVATVLATLAGAGLLAAVALPIGAFFATLDAAGDSGSSRGTLDAMGDALTLFAPSVVALGVLGLLTRASYVRGRPVVAGLVAGTAWLATAVLPLLVLLLDDAAGGPATLRALTGGASLGLAGGAVLLTVLVGRSWGWRSLAVPVRSLVGVTAGAVLAAVVGRAASAQLLATGAGESLPGSFVIGLASGAVALAILGAIAVAIDASLLRRLRALRPRKGDSR